MRFTRLKWLIIREVADVSYYGGALVDIFKVRKEQIPVNYFPKPVNVQFSSTLPILVLPFLSQVFNSNSLVLVFP